MRWWIYQKERFPLLAHGPLILVFSYASMGFTQKALGLEGWPFLGAAGVAFSLCLIAFLHLRLADEFKDHEEDLRWRPYRPVPRGLVTLKELAVVWIFTALIQVTLAWTFHRGLLLILLLEWLYLGLMTKEFFVRNWLSSKPVLYLISHMGIMPLVDALATACVWLPENRGMPAALGTFLGASFANGMVIEIGRKIRDPLDEEEGVQTYSALWGKKRAVMAWMGVLLLTSCLAVWAVLGVESGQSTSSWLTVLLSFMMLFAGGVAWVCLRFFRQGGQKSGRWFEWMSALWTLGLYGILGIYPLI